jgi:hypothetical protein
MPKKSPLPPEVVAYLKKEHPEIFRASRSEVRAIDAALASEDKRHRDENGGPAYPFGFAHSFLFAETMLRAVEASERPGRHKESRAAREAAIGLYLDKYASNGTTKDEAARLIGEELFMDEHGNLRWTFETIRGWLKGLTVEDPMPEDTGDL